MKVERRAWRRPEITVLVRTKPEEAVLGACKIDDVSVGPFETCHYYFSDPCLALGTS